MRLYDLAFEFFRQNVQWWRWIILCIGVLVSLSTFWEKSPFWGYTFHILNLPYGSKKQALGALWVLFITSYPFFGGLWKWVDILYVGQASIVAPFFSFQFYYVSIAIIQGVNIADSFERMTYTGNTSSGVFFDFINMWFAVLATLVYLILTLRLAQLKWNSIFWLAVGIVASSIVAVPYFERVYGG